MCLSLKLKVLVLQKFFNKVAKYFSIGKNSVSPSHEMLGKITTRFFWFYHVLVFIVQCSKKFSAYLAFFSFSSIR